jgi:uncharacterized HAD superfamily protein
MTSNKTQEKLNLGFDIDGVIADFSPSLIKTIKTNYGLNVKATDIYCFDLDIVLGIPHAEEEQLIAEVLKQDLPLNVGAKETLERLSREGHSIYLLTCRYGYLRDITQSWLKEKGVPYNELHLLTAGEKYLSNVAPLDLIAEDSLQEALGWATKVKTVLIYDQPWNKTLNVKNLTKRVYNWTQIYDEVQKIEAATCQKPILTKHK